MNSSIIIYKEKMQKIEILIIQRTHWQKLQSNLSQGYSLDTTNGNTYTFDEIKSVIRGINSEIARLFRGYFRMIDNGFMCRF